MFVFGFYSINYALCVGLVSKGGLSLGLGSIGGLSLGLGSKEGLIPWFG